MSEREAVVRCPRCNEDRYEVYRESTGQEGVFHHVTVPPERAGMKQCHVCGTNLERKR